MQVPSVSITECPRDAMQGIKEFVPTSLKTEYLNLLLKVGFDRLDFGSFVSPKAIPQMRDTAEVLAGLTPDTDTKLLAIIANTRGARDAVKHERIDILGFPLSVSETFQQRNTNSSRAQSLETVKEIVDLCADAGKTPLVYLSMGFGNPYGDDWNEHIVAEYAERLYAMGVREFALADTVGNSDEEKIKLLYPFLTRAFPSATWGLHLHSRPEESLAKLNAALDVGCRRFDTALRGFGGCPMAKDDLTGNIATESLLALLETRGVATELDMKAWSDAIAYSWKIFY